MGAVLIADLTEGIPALANAVFRAREWPWCPLVCMLTDRRIPAAVLGAFEPIPGIWAALYASDYAHLTPTRRALAAVHRRPVPRGTTIAQWIELRLRLPGVGSVLAACFGDEGDERRPRRTLTRRVRELGPLAVRDWRGLARIAQILAARSLRAGTALETAAFEAGVDPRTLRRWLQLATDRSWREASEMAGWEWVLETALRRWGYVNAGSSGRWAVAIRSGGKGRGRPEPAPASHYRR